MDNTIKIDDLLRFVSINDTGIDIEKLKSVIREIKSKSCCSCCRGKCNCHKS